MAVEPVLDCHVSSEILGRDSDVFNVVAALLRDRQAVYLEFFKMKLNDIADKGSLSSRASPVATQPGKSGTYAA